MKEKLNSRKFWITVFGVLTTLAAGFGLSDNPIVHAVTIIMGALETGVYVFCQTKIDCEEKNHE